MNFNIDFDLKKAKSLLLSEGYQEQGFESEDDFENYYNDSNFINEEEVERLGIYADIDNDLLNGDWDSDDDKIEYLNSIIDYCNKEIQSIQLYNPDSLEEMAKLTGKEGVLTPLGQKAAEIIKNNPELEKGALLNTLKSDPEIAQILNDTEEELYQNQTNQFASLVRGSREIGQRGRKSDPNKPAAEPKVKAEKPAKEKSPKLKITNPTADEKPVSSTFIDGEDEEDMADEMAAMKAAKGNKRLGTAAEKLAQVTKEMKALIPAYQAAKGTDKESAIVAQLRDLTAEKKSLEAKVFKAPKSLSAADLMGGEEV
jgi:hypothetical protein